MRNEQKKQCEKVIIYSSVFVLIAWLLNWMLLLFVYCEPAERGQFGDMFGAVNSLFSGLSIIGIIYTLLEQNKQLRNQEKEIDLAKDQNNLALYFDILKYEPILIFKCQINNLNCRITLLNKGGTMFNYGIEIYEINGNQSCEKRAGKIRNNEFLDKDQEKDIDVNLISLSHQFKIYVSYKNRSGMFNHVRYLFYPLSDTCIMFYEDSNYIMEKFNLKDIHDKFIGRCPKDN